MCQLLILYHTRQKCIPLHGLFELTPLCNLNCKMCYVHLDVNHYKPETLLSISDWKGLVQSAYSAGMRDAIVTGGECLTYSGFDEVYILLYELHIATSIFTNGVLLTNDRIDFFKKYPPKAIQVSLYGSSNEHYAEVTGVDAFDTVISNIIAAKEAKLPIRIAITPSQYMADDLINIIKLVRSLHIPYKINSGLIAPRPETERKMADISPEQYIELYKFIRQGTEDSIKQSEDLVELPDANQKGEKKLGLQCGGGRSSFVIKYDGTMCPCLPFYDVFEKPLEIGFMDAWKRINRFANHYPIPQECNGCIYEKYCFRCAASHRNAPIGHCDRALCDTIQLYIKGGVVPPPQTV